MKSSSFKYNSNHLILIFLVGLVLYLYNLYLEKQRQQQIENFSIRKIKQSVNSTIVRPIRKTKEGIQDKYNSILRSFKKMIR